MGAYQAEMIGILREARLSLKHPPLDAAEYLEILRVQGLARTCGVLGDAALQAVRTAAQGLARTCGVLGRFLDKL